MPSLADSEWNQPIREQQRRIFLSVEVRNHHSRHMIAHMWLPPKISTGFVAVGTSYLAEYFCSEKKTYQ